MLAMLIGALLSILPAELRPLRLVDADANMRAGAVMGGALQALAFLVALALGFWSHFQYRMGTMVQVSLQAGVEEVLADRNTQHALGFLTLLEYLVQPLSLVFIYFIWEGVVRMAAALVTGEVVGTLPLWLAAQAGVWLRGKRAEAAMGPRVRDAVEHLEGGELRIRSCRPKVNWNELMTISYKEALYEVAAHEDGKPPRRFVYWLRPKPEGKVVRGLHHYDPEETLQK